MHIKSWIDDQLVGSTVTCVLIGKQTDERDWVHYEITQSIARKNAILGSYINGIKDFLSLTDIQGQNPLKKHKLGSFNLSDIAPTYDWVKNDGYNNFGAWIAYAVKQFQNINNFRG